MEFGLWVEPEMVSPDSRLAREHPDWMLAESDEGTSSQHPPTWRYQQTLDSTVPAARAHVLESLCAVLRERFPLLAIESCASGGARIDLGMAHRVHRFWTSDTNDALDRQRIQRYSGILLPPELLGGHVGAPRAHITGRTHDLSFRLATALFGNAGIEWNITTANEEDRVHLREWVATVKRVRSLLSTGRTVRTDEVNDDRYVHGLVAADGSEALIALVTLASSAVAVPPPLRFPGLDADRMYRLEPLTLGGAPHAIQGAPPAWLAEGGITITGRLLADIGVPVPLLGAEQALLLLAMAVN